MIHRIYLLQFIINRNILHDSKKEIHRFRLRAGNDLTVLDLQSGVRIVIFIPCQNGGVILAIPAAVHVNADGIVRYDLSACHLRCQIFFGILVVQLVKIG